MQNLISSRMKTLDQLKSLSGTPRSLGNSLQLSSDAIPGGSFVNLKITAEKLVKEHTSSKSDVEMSSMKMKKLSGKILVLEGKLQEANNENSRLKVKLKEDSKIWHGLEAKLSSTKELCDQMMETLQKLVYQVQEAERDKKFFEDKLATSSKALDDLNGKLCTLRLKLESAEENIRKGKNDLNNLKSEKEYLERTYADEHAKIDMLITEKNSAIQSLEAAISEGKDELQSVISKLQDANAALLLKEELHISLAAKKEQLEIEKSDLLCKCEASEKKLCDICSEMRSLEDKICHLADMMVQIDISSSKTSTNILRLTSSWESYDKLVHKEKFLLSTSAQLKFDRLYARYLEVTSENGVFQSEIDALKNQVTELRKDLDTVTLKSKEEHQIAVDKIQKYHHELESCRSKENELMGTISGLEEKVSNLSSTLSKLENQKEELKMQVLSLESLNRDIQERAESLLQEKKEEIETLREEIDRSCQCVEALETQIGQLRAHLDEKENAELKLKDREKELVEKIAQIQASLSAAECSLVEVKKQYDVMLEGKQLELTRHLKELSQRNDQEINDIRRKYELEKQEIINSEKEKARSILTETERKYEEKMKHSRDKELEHLRQVQEEHDSLITKIQLEYNSRELSIMGKHDTEIKRLEIYHENELKEKVAAIKKEHELNMKAMMHEHEDELRKVQEELEMQKSKEEKQRALLQLQWKVMDDNRQECPEVNSKKAFSASSIKMLEVDVGKEDHHLKLENEKVRNSQILGAVGSPVTGLLNRVGSEKTGGLAGIPKHSKKVTRHEYEVKTANGKTITKRRKSTVMIGNHLSQKKINVDKSVISKHQNIRKPKGSQGPRAHPSGIGDLLRESSLDPYADDPYAFD